MPRGPGDTWATPGGSGCFPGRAVLQDVLSGCHRTCSVSRGQDLAGLGGVWGCREGTPHGACHHSLSLDPSGLFLTPGYSEFEGWMEGCGWGMNEEKDVTTRCQ